MCVSVSVGGGHNMRVSKLSQSLSFFSTEKPKDVLIKKASIFFLYSFLEVQSPESSKNNVLEMFRAATIKPLIRRR